MPLRRVIQEFRATRVSGPSCSELEGSDLSGDEPISVGYYVNDNPDPLGGIVDGEEYVRFIVSHSTFCVKRSIYEASTEPCS